MNIIFIFMPFLILFIFTCLFSLPSYVSGFLALISILICSAIFENIEEFFYLLEHGCISVLFLGGFIVFIIFSGTYLNCLMRINGTTEGIIQLIKNFPVTDEMKILILIFGFIPMLECMTGFGISLFISVPIFINLFGLQKGLRLSMLGMNIMPWGTIGLATFVGASLTHYSVHALGTMTALSSFLVFPYLACVSVYIFNGNKISLKRLFQPILVGNVFATLLFCFNYYGSVELSGILSGLTTSILIFFAYSTKSFSTLKFRNFYILKPYLIIITFLLITRLYSPIKIFMENHLVYNYNGINIEFLLNPALILLMTALFIHLNTKKKISFSPIFKLVLPASFNIFIFLFISQVMILNGMVSSITLFIKHGLSGFFAKLIAPIIAMLSGFLTGSNTAANSLMIRVQQSLGMNYDKGLLFSAIQNAASGLVIFTTIPIITMIIVIAKDQIYLCIQKNIRELLLFGMKVCAGIYFFIMLMCFLCAHFSVSSQLFLPKI